MTTPATGQAPYTFTKHQRVYLRDVGKDERWLQGVIEQEPSILGLGDLVVHSKEKVQRSGGRLDFLLLDTETEPEMMYEVEVMLGATNESHIIHTIEYWDVESRRYRDREHRAFIVAEEITNRFFNVIWLLSRSLPIIALQLNAIRIDDKLLLHFTKVLDLFEQAEVDDGDSPTVDRQTWERRAPGGMRLFDSIVGLLANLQPKPNFRNDWIGFDGRNRRNIVGIRPGKQEVCRLFFPGLRSFSELDNAEIRKAWENAGADLNDKVNQQFSIKLTRQFVDQHQQFIVDQIKRVFALRDQD